MANNLFFPAISRYDTITSNDWIAFYPIVSNNKKYEGGIDGLPRKISMGSLLSWVEDNGTFSASGQITVEDEGTSLGSEFTTLDFVGPYVAATDAGSNQATVTITGSLMSTPTDVSTDYYQGFAAWLSDTRTVWSGNEPSANIAQWIADFNQYTYIMVWNPVDAEWMPMAAFDLVSYLNGAAENIYNTSDTVTSNRVVDLNDKSLSFYTTTGFASDALFFSLNPSATAADNSIRINGHRLRPLETGESDIQLGYFNAAGATASKNSILWFPQNTVNGGIENAAIYRDSGANGVFHMWSDGTGDIYIQNGVPGGTSNRIILDNAGQVSFSEYGSGTHTGTATYTLQVDSSGNIIEGAVSGANTNFAENDLTADANRSHNFASFDLLMDNINDWDVNAEGEVFITANNQPNHLLKGFTSGNERSWFFRASDGTDSVTIQLIANSTTGTSQIELGTGNTGAPILFDTDGYVQVDGQAAQSGEFRIEALGGQHYVAFKQDTDTSGAASYTLTYPKAGPSANDIIKLDGSGNISFDSLLGLGALSDPGADEFLVWDDSASALAFASVQGTHNFSALPAFYITESMVIAVSDETTALTTGTAKVTFRMPYKFRLTEVRASLTGAGSTSGTTIVDINESGSTILSTKLTIDQGEKTSTTAAIPAVISDGSLADDAEITIDIDGVTGGANETGLKVYLIGYQID